MHNTGEIMQLCRLCLVKEQVNVPIFEGQGDVRQIFQKISSCLPVKINRSDKLPKNICDGCSEKLDLFYDFWNTSVNSEKQLLEWLGQTPLSAGAGTTIAAKNSTTKPTDPVQQIKVDVKQEPSDHTDNNESFQAEAAAMADDDEFKEESAPPPKRARRAVTKRKPITVAPDSDDDDDDDYEPVEPLTKLEDESGNSDNDNDNDNEDDSFAAPSTSADDQPGPSGLGKDGVEAPYKLILYEDYLKNENEEYETIQIEIEDFKNPDIKVEFQIDENEKPNENIKKDEEKVKGSSGKLLCPICGLLFRRSSISKHIHNHGTFQCKVCRERFKYQDLLLKHEKVHKNNKYTCEICSHSYNDLSDLALHKYKHFHVYSCPICNFVTKKGQCLKHHINRHEKKFKYVCSICNQGFPMAKLLEYHEEIHIDIKKYVCDICGKKFAVERYLKAHKKYNHNQEMFECEVCSRQFTFQKSLVRHLSLIHDIGESMRVQCKICNKTMGKSFIKKHMRIHTGEKAFVCELCGKGFYLKKSLQRHSIIHERVTDL